MIKSTVGAVCSLAIACAVSGAAVADTTTATTHVVPDTDNTGVIPPHPPVSKPPLASPARTAVVPETTNQGGIPPGGSTGSTSGSGAAPARTAVVPDTTNQNDIPPRQPARRVAVVPDTTNDGTIPPPQHNISAG